MPGNPAEKIVAEIYPVLLRSPELVLAAPGPRPRLSSSPAPPKAQELESWFRSGRAAEGRTRGGIGREGSAGMRKRRRRGD